MSRKANPEWAVPGDTIEIIKSISSTGEQYVVIDCPVVTQEPHVSGSAWVMASDRLGFWRPEYYKIVKRKKEGVSTPSIVNDTPVDLEKSLRQKRDQLLRGYFT